MSKNNEKNSRTPAEQEAYLMMEWIATKTRDILDETKFTGEVHIIDQGSELDLTEFKDEIHIIDPETKLELEILERVYALEMFKVGYSTEEVKNIMRDGNWMYEAEEDPDPEWGYDLERFC